MRYCKKGVAMLAASLLLVAGPGRAQSAVTLPGVVAVGERPATSVPASIDVVDAGDVPAPVGVGVAEYLRRMPGVAARERQNLAQDVQVTIRGFGARTTFGVRGLRIYVDGIPATMPDGQGQVSHVPLRALSEVVVLRGPFSALYGNASGGVLQFFSKDPAARHGFSLDTVAGPDDLRRTGVGVSGPWGESGGEGEGGYRIDAEHLDSGGYRDHSRTRRDVAQARLTGRTGGGTGLALTANSFDIQAQDPQGLTAAQVRADPRSSSAGALAFNTRKTVRQRQAGLRIEQPLDGHGRLEVGLHAGSRDTWQMLSIPVFVQEAPGSGGGVIDLAREYGGIDARWELDGSLAGKPAGITVGVEWQRSSERRRGYENFIGDRQGVAGRLRRDQRDSVRSRDAYAEARWRFLPQWQATLGVRRSEVSFRSDDDYIAAGNPDDSGALDFGFTTPAIGLLYRPAEGVEWYANAGRGYETPSASELAYRADGASGLNTALRPSRSRSHELGLRVQRGDHAWAVALFDSRTEDELVVAASGGGRSIYANAADTRRRGFELSASGWLGARWHYALAATALDARFADDTHIPGTTERSAWAELRWHPTASLQLFLAGNGSSRLYANDDNDAWAPGQATFDIGVEREWQAGQVALVGFARVDNVFDRQVIGSVIVNDGNGRYFEPAPGRGVTVGLRIDAPQ
ncbi:MAG: TonB-dependent receptor [Pseudomonadota bacterium]|nr:TonB-dependent receptor [Pseudomonadota bacterium]